MNLFKSSLSGLLFILLLATSASSIIAHAEDATTSKSGSPTSNLIATVNITDARILEQKNGVFTLAFTLSNRDGIQSGVKYGVQLIADNAKFISDEKVYDESLTLAENSLTKKEIAYIAPAYLDGSYNLLITSKNENNLPLATVSLGKVKLTSSQKGVYIAPESCYLQVEGEKGAPHYTLLQTVDIEKTETLRLNCSAVNNTAETLTLTPFFQTRYYSSFGKLATQIGGDYKSIAFKKGEKKNISILIPKGDAAQTYSLKFSLMDAKNISNTINASYLVRGVTATISKLSLDKDSYKIGDKGEMHVVWSVTTGNIGRNAGKGSAVPLTTFEATIKNDKGVSCVDPISQKLIRNLKDPQTHISFSSKSTCDNPIVSASIKDDKGNTLYNQDFAFKSAPEASKEPINNKLLTILAIVAVVIVGLALYIRSRKNSNVTLS